MFISKVLLHLRCPYRRWQTSSSSRVRWSSCTVHLPDYLTIYSTRSWTFFSWGMGTVNGIRVGFFESLVAGGYGTPQGYMIHFGPPLVLQTLPVQLAGRRRSESVRWFRKTFLENTPASISRATSIHWQMSTGTRYRNLGISA